MHSFFEESYCVPKVAQYLYEIFRPEMTRNLKLNNVRKNISGRILLYISLREEADFGRILGGIRTETGAKYVNEVERNFRLQADFQITGGFSDCEQMFRLRA